MMVYFSVAQRIALYLTGCSSEDTANWLADWVCKQVGGWLGGWVAGWVLFVPRVWVKVCGCAQCCMERGGGRYYSTACVQGITASVDLVHVLDDLN